VAALRRWSLILALLGWAAVAAAQEAPPTVQLIKLKNGLRVLLAPDTLSPAVDVAVWYRAGTRFEPAGMSGITHLMERWMFRGSPHYKEGEHQRLVMAEGGVANTFTTSDASCFFDTVPAEALELALRLEADRMGSLKLTAPGLERERRIVRDERGQLSRGGALGSGLRRLYATAFPGHPYGWPATGLDRDLDKVTLAACEAYQRAQYSPDNAVLVLSGRFDPTQAMGLVRRHFGSAPPPSAPAKKPAELAPQMTEQRAAERIEGDLPVLLVGWRGPGGADRSTAALDVLARLLGSGPRSRAGQELIGRAPARCIAVESGFDARRDGSLLYVAAVGRPGADSAEVERALLGESEKLAASPPETAELDAAKREAELGLLLEWQTAHGRGQALGMAEAVFGDHRLAAGRFQALRELTPADIAGAAAEVLRPERRSVVWLVPGRGAAAGAGGKGGAR
jgi:zinc protease